jgi:hypothetical protein
LSVALTGNLVAESDKTFRQGLEAPVIIHIPPDLIGLRGGDAPGDFFAVKKALENEIGAELGGGLAFGAEELLAKRTAPEPVNGLHLLEGFLALLEQLVEVWFHVPIVST